MYNSHQIQLFERCNCACSSIKLPSMRLNFFGSKTYFEQVVIVVQQSALYQYLVKHNAVE